MSATPSASDSAAPGLGGKGEETPRRREAVQLAADLRLASVFQAPLTPEFVKRVRDVVRALMMSKKGRQRAAGGRLAIRLMEYNLALVEKADKMGRLDSGQPTERLEHTGEIDLRQAARDSPEILKALMRIHDELKAARPQSAPPADAPS